MNTKILSRLVPFLIVLALIVPGGFQPTSLAQDSIFSLTKQIGGFAKVSYHAETGMVSFIGADQQHPIQLATLDGGETNPEVAARAFLKTYGALFGIQDSDRDLRTLRTRTSQSSRTMARFQQVYRGIPVFGGEIIVNLKDGDQVLSASGEVLPAIEVDVDPLVTQEAAVERAKNKIARQYQVEVETLTASSPELWIYNPILLSAPGPRITSLVWNIEVTSADDLFIREVVLVDAHRGFIVLNLSKVYEAKNRSVYDNQNNTSYGLPGNGPVCTEGSCTATGQANNAYVYSGNAYDFYSANHGRDSIDDSGMAITSTVRYCEPGEPCPYDNAFWNGSQLVFGDSYATDDILAHEYTHGVTEFESQLFYYMQSGAIHESFSDIWGELIDQGNGLGNDSAGVRWLLGEDAVVILSLSNPPAYGDPDKMSSSLYNCDLGEYDNGGVHSNSGIGNKAAYLMVDGGTFNGRTVTALGSTKTAKIFYEVQTNLLTSASDYNDLYDALQQACTNLIGVAGITSGDCQEVKDAVEAVEMNLLPAACPASEAPVCMPGQTRTDIFFDDMENTGSGNWVSGALSGTDRWYYPQNSNPFSLDMTYATSGVTNIWGYDQDEAADYYIAMANNVSIPGGTDAYLHFDHSYHFEGYSFGAYDGGVIEYSLNGGAWTDAGSLIVNNGYKGTISSGSGNPLQGRQAFVQESSGYISSRLDLTSLAGNNVKFRYRIGTDNIYDSWGWFIDDVRIYTCSGSSQNVFLPLVVKSDPTGGWTTIKSETFEGSFPGEWQVADYQPGFGEYYWGKRNCRSYSGSYSGWAVGAGANGKNLTCGKNYPDYAYSWMIYGPFNLASATAADLSFKMWLYSESGFDGLCWMASIDGENFIGYCSSGNSGGWVDADLDLTAVPDLGDLRGLKDVWIGFLFTSDEIYNFSAGAYIDNILLRKCMQPNCVSPTTSLNTLLNNEEMIIKPAQMKRTLR